MRFFSQTHPLHTDRKHITHSMLTGPCHFGILCISPLRLQALPPTLHAPDLPPHKHAAHTPLPTRAALRSRACWKGHFSSHHQSTAQHVLCSRLGPPLPASQQPSSRPSLFWPRCQPPIDRTVTSSCRTSSAVATMSCCCSYYRLLAACCILSVESFTAPRP